ncbi:hypothetical protein [Streptomyces sp. NPDC093223]|uniref:hypothetical protein n=1 Tax=Streptomyces sp. NPDC093223 TaxID=3366033 RepID=UPI0037F6089C
MGGESSRGVLSSERQARRADYQQEPDLPSLYKDVASDFCETVTVPEQLPNVLGRAMRTAMARRSVTAPIIPADVLPYATGSI